MGEQFTRSWKSGTFTEPFEKSVKFNNESKAYLVKHEIAVFLVINLLATEFYKIWKLVRRAAFD